MSKKEYLKYCENDEFEFTIEEGDFVTFLGKGNNKLLYSFMFLKKEKNIFIESVCASEMKLYKIRRSISYVLNRDLDTFVSETVEDEIAFGLEGLAIPKNEMRETINLKAREFRLADLLKRNPDSLGSSDKAKLKLLATIIFEPKVLILDNILCELDNDDKVRIVNLLKEYTDKGNIILNFTNDVEETLYGNRIIITDEEKVIADGKTKSILNEDKLMKKLGFGLPFSFELNKYLIDYGIIKRYELDLDKLVDKIWK